MQWLHTLWRRNRGLAVFLGLMAVFRSAVADWNPVPTGSMLPTIQEGDVILVDKLAYGLRVPFTDLTLVRTGEPQRGDIVVFESQGADTRLVKRVAGVPGDVVAMRDNVLILNGQPLRYEPLSEGPAYRDALETLGTASHVARRSRAAVHPLRDFGPVTVPADHYLMLGDNRDNSADSRVYGFVPRSELRGRAHHVLVSFDLARYGMPRVERTGMALR